MDTYPACNNRHGGDFDNWNFDDELGKAFCRDCGRYIFGVYSQLSPIGRARYELIQARAASRTWRARHSDTHYRGIRLHRTMIAGQPAYVGLFRRYVDDNPRRNDRRVRIAQTYR